MGLKSALLGTIANKALQTIATSNEVKKSELTIQNKAGDKSPAYEYMMNSSKNCVVFESCAFHMCSLKEYRGKEKLKYNDFDGKYKIFDKNGILKFLVLEKRRGIGEELTGKDLDKMFLYDLEENSIGRVKEHVVSVKVPVIENDVKTCSVLLGNNKLCDVKRFYKLGKEHFKASSGYELEYVKNKEFVIKKGNKKIAKIIIFRSSLKKHFSRSVVVEFDDVKKEITSVLLAMSIDTICSY